MRISKKNRQHNGQKKKYKRTKHTHKTKDRVTRTPLMKGWGGAGIWQLSMHVLRQHTW